MRPWRYQVLALWPALIVPSLLAPISFILRVLVLVGLSALLAAVFATAHYFILFRRDIPGREFAPVESSAATRCAQEVLGLVEAGPPLVLEADGVEGVQLVVAPLPRHPTVLSTVTVSGCEREPCRWVVAFTTVTDTSRVVTASVPPVFKKEDAAVYRFDRRADPAQLLVSHQEAVGPGNGVDFTKAEGLSAVEMAGGTGPTFALGYRTFVRWWPRLMFARSGRLAA